MKKFTQYPFYKVYLVFIILLPVISAFGREATGSTPFLAAYYPLSGSFEDMTTDGSDYGTNHGGSFEGQDIPNSPTENSIWPYSINEHVLYLDGNDYFEFSDNDYTFGDFSISMWAKLEDDSASDPDHNLVGKHTSSGSNTFLFGFYYNQLYVRIKSDYYYDKTMSEAGVDYGEWHHYVVTVDRIDSSHSVVKVYVDAEKQWETAFNDALDYSDFSNGNPMIVGADWDGSSRNDYVKGYVGEIKFFYTAITGPDSNDEPDDVTSLYNFDFAFPGQMNVLASSIENYSGSTPSLPEAGDHMNQFLSSQQNKIGGESYKIDLGDNMVRTGSTISEQWIWSGYLDDPDAYDIVYHAGHGTPYGIRPQDLSNGTYFQEGYGENTKWVVFDACHTLSSSGYAKHYMRGYEPYTIGAKMNTDNASAHVVLGFKSRSYEYDYWTSGWFPIHIESKYFLSEFWQNWAVERKTIWNAWKDAVQDSLYQPRPSYLAGIAPAILYGKNDDSYSPFPSHQFNGKNEKIWNVFQEGVDTCGGGSCNNHEDSIGYDYVEFGDPLYSDEL